MKHIVSLTRASASHNANFFPWFNIYVEIIEDYGRVVPVSHTVVCKGNGAILWPAAGNICVLDTSWTL